MIYLYLFGTCFHFIYVFMIIYHISFRISLFCSNFAFKFRKYHYHFLNLLMSFWIIKVDLWDIRLYKNNIRLWYLHLTKRLN